MRVFSSSSYPQTSHSLVEEKNVRSPPPPISNAGNARSAVPGTVPFVFSESHEKKANARLSADLLYNRARRHPSYSYGLRAWKRSAFGRNACPRHVMIPGKLTLGKSAALRSKLRMGDKVGP